MANILIFGTGAVGCVYAWICQQSQRKVTVVCRSNYEAIKSDGIRIDSELWGQLHFRPAVVRTAEESAASNGPFDFIIVCAKAFPGISQAIKAAVSEHTAIVVAQNGIAVKHEYAEAYPRNTIISAVIWLSTTQPEPGRIRMGSKDLLEIGTYPSNAPKEAKELVKRLSKVWQDGGATVQISEDIQERRWSKVAINCAFNPMAALTKCNSGQLLRSSELADQVIV